MPLGMQQPRQPCRHRRVQPRRPGQLERFQAREEIPFKRFKITEDDWRNRDKWDDYRAAVGDMVDRTSTEVAALAARMLERIDPALQPPAAVRSTGVEPLLLTGDVSGSIEDVVAELRVDTLAEFDRVLGRIRGVAGVINSETSLLLSSVLR